MGRIQLTSRDEVVLLDKEEAEAGRGRSRSTRGGSPLRTAKHKALRYRGSVLEWRRQNATPCAERQRSREGRSQGTNPATLTTDADIDSQVSKPSVQSKPRCVAAGRRRVFFIGIAGPSGAGKTTLSKQLAKDFQSPVVPIEMDWFLDPKRMPTDSKYGKNWETPEGVDFPLLLQDLRRVEEALSHDPDVPSQLQVGPTKFEQDIVAPTKQGGRPLGKEPVVVIVAGFLLFYDAAVCRLLSSCIWLEPSCEICMERRQKRGKASRKRSRDEFASWYKDMVWASHQRCRTRQLSNAGSYLQLDGAAEREGVLQEALDHCRSALQRWQASAAAKRPVTPPRRPPPSAAPAGAARDARQQRCHSTPQVPTDSRSAKPKPTRAKAKPSRVESRGPPEPDPESESDSEGEKAWQDLLQWDLAHRHR